MSKIEQGCSYIDHRRKVGSKSGYWQDFSIQPSHRIDSEPDALENHLATSPTLPIRISGTRACVFQRMNFMNPIVGRYDYRLVALSLAVAIVTSYTALDLAGRVAANRGTSRVVWLTGGALSTGSGIWCMHYTGMLAFLLPIRVSYHVPTVAFSLLASILALYIVSRTPMTSLHVVAGKGTTFIICLPHHGKVFNVKEAGA
ncbi:MHYT domain-containing protein [Telmatobacter bradus]|uniref:MHYT domain-containing protein n=1 Tax=Telmatobacter bradus TaxID=474953 RepID=UPI003B4343CC